MAQIPISKFSITQKSMFFNNELHFPPVEIRDIKKKLMQNFQVCKQEHRVSSSRSPDCSSKLDVFFIKFPKKINYLEEKT